MGPYFPEISFYKAKISVKRKLCLSRYKKMKFNTKKPLNKLDHVT